MNWVKEFRWSRAEEWHVSIKECNENIVELARDIRGGPTYLLDKLGSGAVGNKSFSGCEACRNLLLSSISRAHNELLSECWRTPRMICLNEVAIEETMCATCFILQVRSPLFSRQKQSLHQ